MPAKYQSNDLNWYKELLGYHIRFKKYKENYIDVLNS